MGFTWFHKSSPDLSAKLDVLLDAGDNAPNLTERRDKFHAAQKIIGENYLGVPISQGFTVYAMVKELKGVKYNDAGHAMFNAAHLSATRAHPPGLAVRALPRGKARKEAARVKRCWLDMSSAGLCAQSRWLCS